MLGEIIADLSNWMYTYLLVILLVAAGLFFTIRNRFPQLRLLREAIRVVVERPEKEGSVSSFQALMVSTASRVGTGNIIGVSVAICMGGYGAVFWMWLIALLGAPRPLPNPRWRRFTSAGTRRPARVTAALPIILRRPSTAVPWRCCLP